jgi:hypothetical protein
MINIIFENYIGYSGESKIGMLKFVSGWSGKTLIDT